MSHFLFKASSLVVAMITCFAPSRSTAAEYPIAFDGVDVISVEAGGLLEDQTVVVQGDKIVSMGKRDATAVPSNTLRIDGTGKFLMAGLADVHVHLPTDGFMSAMLKKEVRVQPLENMLFLFVANGVTTVRVMSGFPELLELRDRIARGEVLGPRLIVCTPMFDGKKPLWPAPFSRAIDSPEEARAAVRESKAIGYDLIKVYSFIARDAYDAMMDEAQKVGLKVVGHVPLLVGLEHAFASGQHEVTHVEEFWRFTRDYSDEVLQRFTTLIAESGTWFSPTLSTYTNAARQFEDMDAMLARDEMRYMDPAVVEWWAPPHNRFLGANDRPELNARSLEAFEPRGTFMMQLVKRFHDAGVPLETGTDALNPMSIPGFGIHDELAEFVNAGVPELEAIRAATVRPAEFMNESRDWGSVAVGQRADLVLLSANPLENIRNSEQIDGVMTRGRWLTKREIQNRLDEIAQQHATLSVVEQN